MVSAGYRPVKQAAATGHRTIHRTHEFGKYIYIVISFNMQQFYVLPTQCIYVFCVDLRTNSDYFPIQH